MSRHAAIELDWADGTYTFRLGLSEIEELERKRDLGIFQIVTRLSPEIRQCRLPDISEVIRLGLIGGGKSPTDALVLVRRYVDERPIDENRDTAYAIALAGLMRVHTSEVEKPSGEPEAAKTDGSISPPSQDQPS
ncbi:gene transfer agent family protein [Rhizobium setariae]|uniref:gene transfer agent family protein n=1 Tax=Rhizobium setariae TaxID=2801340 RepID=UPI0031BA32CE